MINRVHLQAERTKKKKKKKRKERKKKKIKKKRSERKRNVPKNRNKQRKVNKRRNKAKRNKEISRIVGFIFYQFPTPTFKLPMKLAGKLLPTGRVILTSVCSYVNKCD